VGGNSKKMMVATNFISQQSFINVQMSYYLVVLLIIHFQGKYHELAVLLHLIRSDVYEFF